MNQPTILMVHGLIDAIRPMDPASRMRSIHVELIDLLGYGAMRTVAPVTLDEQARHVARRVHDYRNPVWLLGHSMGGAVAILAADRCGDQVAGVINVEGNFTMKDTFWSRSIAKQSSEEWTASYNRMVDDVAAWLLKCDLDPTPQLIAWAKQMLALQPPETLHAMANAILVETARPAYLDTVRRWLEKGVPLHLIAGEKSAGVWDVPGFVRQAACSDRIIPAAGHLMMLEQPDAFCRAIESAIAASDTPAR